MVAASDPVVLSLLLTLASVSAAAQSNDAVSALAQREKQPLLDTLKALVETVTGRASHAGNAPDQGRNALYELSHQLLQLRDLSDPSRAVKLNWTLANAGSVYNAIPAAAMAIGDMRADDRTISRPWKRRSASASRTG